MSLRKLILLVVFFWGSADSKQPGGFKIQMKDGNFFFDDGNGDVPIEMIDKGPDLSCLQDGGPQSKSSSSNLMKTLKILDKTLSDLGNDSDNKKPFSELGVSNQREKISELRRLLGETNLVETFHGDENDLKSSSKENAQDIQNINSPAKENKDSKISDTDLEKIREVLDKEYGKSILLIPKNDLETFIHIVKDYSLNDFLKSNDNAELKNSEDRVRLRNPPNAPHFQLNLNRMLSSKPRSKVDNQETSEDNRQQIMQEFARFLDELNFPKESVVQETIKQNGLNTFGDANILSTSVNQNDKNLPHQEPVSLEAFKGFLDHLSDDKSQLKQSLLRWFEKNSENDASRQRHLNFRRSPRKSPTTSSPVKKDKKNKKNQQKSVKSNSFLRVSRGDYPNYEKHKRKMTLLPTLNQIKSSLYGIRDNQELTESNFNSGANREQKENEQSNFKDEIDNEKETAVSGERQTRADFIR